MTDSSFEDFANFIKTAKGRKRLHPLVEKRLSLLLSRMYPDAAPIPEVYGIPGGRHDLMQFFFNERRVVFELFCSPSQVPQDLRLLEQSTADVKIAILLDRQINPKLANEYFRKKPDHFPFLWLSQVLIPRYEAVCLARLHELIDENASIIRLRRVLSTPKGSQIEDHFRKQLERIEAALQANKSKTVEVQELTFEQLIALRKIAQLRKIGIQNERLRSLYAWLQNSISFAITIVEAGYQAFLITDLDGQHAIWSDGDLADYLFNGADYKELAEVVICLNKFVNDLWESIGEERRPIHWHIFHSYREYIAEIVTVWEQKEFEAQNNSS